MTKSLAQILIDEHLVSGRGDRPSEEIEIRIDQVLLQDASGPMALLQFQAMELDRVKQEIAVMYADHQTLQLHPLHNEGHRFLLGFCQKFGIHYSKPGNGICHNVHLEDFSRPGQSLAGTDSHTPQAGAVGMLAIGAGGIDVAITMAEGTLHFMRPEIIEVHLTGRLAAWSSAKDVILEVLRRLSNRGGVDKFFEYTGPGMETLSVPERFTIASMGTELGLTGSVFPSDLQTKDFFERINRPSDWQPLSAEPEAEYDGIVELDLGTIEPLIALPSNPDKVVPVKKVAGTPISQIVVGSCTNGSFSDIALLADVLRGRRVAPEVDVIVFPGSRQTFEELAREGHLADLLASGVLVSESTCGSCPGYGHVPAPGTNSLRTFNRNFPGRSGLTEDAVYLCSPETAAASALKGAIADPRECVNPPEKLLPKRFAGDKTGIVFPAEDPERIELLQSPNIAPVPIGEPMEDKFEGEVLIKLGDSVSTDTIIPAGAEAITYRTNIPALSEFTFGRTDPDFVHRAKKAGGGFIVGGNLYGQGSAREHAAICPMFLGVRAVFALSYGRIHRANLINWGILPLIFSDPDEWTRIQLGHRFRMNNLREGLSKKRFSVENLSLNSHFDVECPLTIRERRVLVAGGALAHTKSRI